MKFEKRLDYGTRADSGRIDSIGSAGNAASGGRSLRSCSAILTFYFILFGIAIATMVTPSIEFSETENRILAGKPEMHMEAILDGSFETAYESYLTDQFVGRNGWITLKTAVERLLLKRESKDIYFGEDDYLIEKHTGSFATRRAERNIEALADFAEQYEAQLGEGHVSVMIVPNAVDILQDKLPPFAEAGGGSGYLAQLWEALPDSVWFDCASILWEHAGEEIYYRTDHHWKTLAAFYVYQAWAARQGYAVHPLSDYTIRTVADCFEGTVQSKLGIRTAGDTIELFSSAEEPAYFVYRERMGDGEAESSLDGTSAIEDRYSMEGGGSAGENHFAENSLYDYSALETKDKYAVYFGGNEPFLQIRTELSNGRKILVIKDSYANCFIPFMLEEFREIDLLDLRYTNRSLSEIVDEGGYTDILVLYNVSGFAEDMNISKLKL